MLPTYPTLCISLYAKELITLPPFQRFILLNPLSHINFPKSIRRVTHYDTADASIDNETFTHGAAASIRYELSALRLFPDQKKSGAKHIAPGGGNDGVSLRMNAAAKLISFAARNIQLHRVPISQIRTISPSSGRAYISGWI